MDTYHQENDKSLLQISITKEDYDKSVQEVNAGVKPIGLAGIKFVYTDWMDPRSSDNYVQSLDRMVGDYQFTCPVLEFAQGLAESSNANKYGTSHVTQI